MADIKFGGDKILIWDNLGLYCKRKNILHYDFTLFSRLENCTMDTFGGNGT